MKLIGAFIVLLCCFGTTNAQLFKEFDKRAMEFLKHGRQSDSSYVEFYDQLGIHLSSSYYLAQFSIMRSDDRSRKRFTGNVTPTLGIGITKYGFQLNISKELRFLERSVDELGSTKRLSGYMSFGFNGFGGSAGFSRIQGFYVSNVKIDGEVIPMDEYLVRPDIKKIQYFANLIYVFNRKKYALGAAYSLTQKQLKSAGSFHVGGELKGIHVIGDSVMINASEIPNVAPVLKTNMFDLGLHAGYGYNLVFLRNFVFNLTLSPSASFVYTFSDLESDQMTERVHKFSIRPGFNASAGIAYMKNKFYIGVNAMTQYFWAHIDTDSDFQSGDGRARLIVGFRLK